MTLPIAGTPPARPSAGDGQGPVKHASRAVKLNRIAGGRPGNEATSLTDFVDGVDEGICDVAKGTVAEVRAALTTNR